MYTLFNKKTNKQLIHPQVGLWFTPNLEEAVDLLYACHEYVESVGMQDEKGNFVVIDVETNKEM